MSHSKRILSHRSQRGVTMFGLLFWAVLVGAVSVVAIKVFPVVTEYQTISRMVNKLAREGGSTVPEIRMSFERFKTVEYGIESITARDLEISKEDDKVVISFAYDKEIELLDPVYLLLKFKGRSK
ncbi:MAG: hypothetical protein RJB60_2565 [Pseudomonadota bacterium]|jgi:hypothetical protein